MITITIDLHNYEVPPLGVITAAQVEDYVPVRLQIRHALDSHEALNVYVTHQTVLHWLGDLREYPSSVIRWQYVDPDQAFTALFGIAPPPLFTSELIKSLNLESLPQPRPGSDVDPVSWILGHRLNSVWGHTETSPLHFAHLVATITEEESAYPQVLMPLIEQQLRTWGSHDQNYQALKSITLADDAKRLIYRWVFQHYDPNYLSIDYHSAPLMTMGHTQATRYVAVIRKQAELIRSYWSRWFAEAGYSNASLKAAIGQMSGLSYAELSTLKQVFDRNPELLDQPLWMQISTRFSGLPEARAILQDLAHHIAPKLPQIPDKQWNKEQYLQWATQDYMPYFNWIIRHKQNREHQQICASAFGDWLINQYPSWLNSSTSPVIMNNYSVMRQLLDDDPHAVVLWLIVDGLTWWQGSLLHQACEAHGLHLQMYQPNVSALPSITTISKRILVTGVTHADPSLAIASSARIQLSQSGIPHFVSYDLQEGLKRLSQGDESRCYVLLDNMLDTIAHQMAEFTDNRTIQGHLEDIAQLAGSMYQRCEEKGLNFHVLISSDHGSTILPSDATMLPLPRNTHEIDEYDEAYASSLIKPQPRSTRAASITDLGHLLPEQREEWYILDKDRYQLAHHYIVPRGYHYVGRRPPGWTHGGLTPEEVIVPFMHLTSQRRRVEPLQVRILGGLQAFQPSELTLEIVNSNMFPFQGVTITFTNPSILVVSDKINPSGVTHIHVAFPASMTDKSELTAEWRLEANIFGASYGQQGQVKIPIRRLQTQDSLDDFFPDM